MKRKDLRNNIIPTKLNNYIKIQGSGNVGCQYTIDYIYLRTADEHIYERFYNDYALANNISKCGSYSREGPYHYIASPTMTRTGYGNNFVICVVGQYIKEERVDWQQMGIGPSFRYKIPEESEINDLNIQEVEEKYITYHTVKIGEYPKNKVDEELSEILETLYNGGNIKKGIKCTGRWYTCNGEKGEYAKRYYSGKHNPEFEYQGKRYVRVASNPAEIGREYTDKTKTGEYGSIIWIKVEPISCIINNWDKMPKSINPNGSEETQYFDLTTEYDIISGIPFHIASNPEDIYHDTETNFWCNSLPRGFLNGISVEYIKGVDNYSGACEGRDFRGPCKGGDFSGSCNFLNEAFNLSRRAIRVYEIPKTEVKIPDDAFNGCITLKTVIIHSKVKSIGERAFDGIDFKYAYRTKKGELAISKELPKDKNENTNVIELSKIPQAFGSFDYNMLIEMSNFKELSKFFMNLLLNNGNTFPVTFGRNLTNSITNSRIINFDEFSNLIKCLTDNKFTVPWAFGRELINSRMTNLLCENSDFRFFKNEVPSINEALSEFPNEEKLDFFKFATCLGCFSKKKMMDKQGKETEVLIAQKASSLLAIILNTGIIKLR